MTKISEQEWKKLTSNEKKLAWEEYDRKEERNEKTELFVVLLVSLILFIVLCIGFMSETSIAGYKHSSSNKAYAEEIKASESHRELSRHEQVRIMQECYADAYEINNSISASIEKRFRVAELFFIYRTGMAINLVQPELSQWIDE